VVDVPCHAPEERLPACRVPTFSVQEQDGWIWVSLGGNPEGPPRYPQLSGYGWFELENVVSAPIDLVLENGLDCSHTGFAHEGLFRSAPTQFVSADLEETATGVRVETVEASPRRSWDVRRILGRRREIRHVDEIILPHTLRVDYRMGEDVHVITVLVCTPETAQRTRLHTRMGVRHGVLTPLITRYVEWLTRRIVAQDLAILTSQAERIRQFGGRDFRGVTADLPAAWYQRCTQRAAREAADRPLRRRRIEYRL
jgi:phenylpropionate dioxygenase-like ring-hydroxylating dioxygenase large terminal subunit